jgi:hypothetical protein
MKELPKYFVIKRDAKNPLWGKYIDWLSKTYSQRWKGDLDYFYGFDGNYSYGGTNTCVCVKNFENSPTIITLEEWNETVNGLTLPDKWCVKINDDNREILDSWRKAQPDYLENKNIPLHNYLVSDKNWDKTYCSYAKNLPEDGEYKEITFEQFKKYVLNKETMEKKIIGYKLIKPEYETAAIKITDFSDEGPGSFSVFMLTAGKQGFANNLEKAGVLDLWFEPIYEEKYVPKKGDYITFTEGKGKGDTVKVIDVSTNFDHMYWIKHYPKSFSGGGFGYKPYKNAFRKATDEEIKKLNTPTIIIKGYEAKFTEDVVTFGCKKYTKEFVADIVDFLDQTGLGIDYEKEIRQVDNYFRMISND